MATQDIPGAVAVEGAFSILDGLVDGGAVDGAKLHLYRDTLNPVPTTDWATFTANEATFKGYAAAAPTWSATGFDSTGTPVSSSSGVTFQATDATTPNSIGGAWLSVDVAGPPASGTVLEYFHFSNPVAMNVALQTMTVAVEMQMPAGPGSATVAS
jgi:hypothetical protein